MANLHKVAIIGRVNVGKSSLFNTLIADRKAIISSIAGTTRDRNYAICSWQGLDFQLIDTGGLEDNPLEGIPYEINQQIQAAIKEADLILFVVDAKNGIMPTDKEFSQRFKKLKKPTILAVNKVDNNKLRQGLPEFYRLNLGEPWPISAHSGMGTGDILDEVVSVLKKLKKPKQKKAPAEEKVIKVAIIGKPNVGKSSLVNALIGEKRLIVSDQPHTTRDAQDVTITVDKQKIVLVDTAGWRRQGKQTIDAFEKQSITQSLANIKRSDIAILVTDASQRLSWQDKHLIDEANQAGVGIIILANKWDLIPNKTITTAEEFTKYYRKFFPFVAWVPLLFTSATEKLRLKKILSLVLEIYQEKNKMINSNALDKLLKAIVKKHKPSRGKGTKHPYLYSLKQTSTNPPTFAIKMNFKADLHDSYLRFIENNLRYKFGFTGVPLKIIVQKSQNVQDKK